MRVALAHEGVGKKCVARRLGATALATLVGVAFLTASHPAAALLIEADLSTPGDALLTQDTESGLEWLDLSESTLLTFNEVASGAGGWLARGWRHATTAEVCGLMAAFSAALHACPGSLVLSPGSLDGLIDLLGVTTAGRFGRGTAGWFEDADPSDPDVGLALFVEYSQGDVGGERASAEVVENRQIVFGNGVFDDISGDVSSPNIGHFLVRVIPEPAAGALVAAGLAVVAWARRTGRRRPRGSIPVACERERTSSDRDGRK